MTGYNARSELWRLAVKEIRHILHAGSDETWCGERSTWNFFNLDHATALGVSNKMFVPPGTFIPCPDCLREALKQMGYEAELKSLD